MSSALSRVVLGRPDIAHAQFYRLPGSPDREYYVFIPANCEPGAEPLVLVHGISRNAAELVLRFAPHARRLGVPLIAPLFPRQAYGMYQQVIDQRHGSRADEALFAILADASARWDLSHRRIALFGFSGGGQFAHRFAILHPQRVRVCIPVSAGWYSWPDVALRWPYGLRKAPLGSVDRAALTQVAFHIVVGARDTRDDDALRRNAKLDALQGTDRVQRAREWHRAMQKAGLNFGGSFTVLPRTRHNFDSAQKHGLVPLVFNLLGHEAGQNRSVM